MFKLLFLTSVVLTILNGHVQAYCHVDDVTDKIYDDVYNSPWPKTSQGKCYYACMLFATKLLKNGEFDVDKFTKIFETEDQISNPQLTDLVGVINECTSLDYQRGQDCDNAAMFLQCSGQRMAKIGLNTEFLTKMVNRTFLKLPPITQPQTVQNFGLVKWWRSHMDQKATMLQRPTRPPKAAKRTSFYETLMYSRYGRK